MQANIRFPILRLCSVNYIEAESDDSASFLSDIFQAGKMRTVA